ncbi:MAG: FeoC-like transcriptional regulator [Sarcina sp.]
MLFKVLRVIYETGNFSTKVISKKCGYSETLVEMIKGELIDKGFLKENMGCEEDFCKDCKLGCSGKSLIKIKSLEITDKGLKILRKE